MISMMSVSTLGPSRQLSGRMSRRVLGQPPVDFPPETAHGALAHYISSPEIKNFQPMNVNFGLIPPLGKRVRGKKIKNAMIAERALEALAEVQKQLNTGL